MTVTDFIKKENIRKVPRSKRKLCKTIHDISAEAEYFISYYICNGKTYFYIALGVKIHQCSNDYVLVVNFNMSFQGETEIYLKVAIDAANSYRQLYLSELSKSDVLEDVFACRGIKI